MDPCHSVSPRSPAYTSTVTVAHLIRNIEQLKNKDKLISQLEKDLGHQWVAAHLAALEREVSEGARCSAMSAPSHPLSVLPKDSYDPNLFPWTPTSTPSTGGVEEAKSCSIEAYTLGKQDLPKMLKDCKERNKELVEKCRAYLQKNKELTAQNRAYKDSSEKVLQENKKMQELLEHSKCRVLQLTRNLSEAQAEKTNLERQTERVDELRKELLENKKAITALKQACANKDRRIELMQHRKKKRRLEGSAEKNMGVKETFFGYEEDTKSVDSENSFSSLSQSTVSDDDVWCDVMTMEETERNYQRLMMEHLQLQRSHTQLHRQCQHIQDPQREALTKMTLQNDLVNAQCKIEKLEKLVNEMGEGKVVSSKERETIIANKENLEKAQFWETEGRRVQQELNKALERCEDLEFQLMEMEQAVDEKQSSSCENNNQYSSFDHHEELEKLAEIDHQQHVAVQEMEELRKELVILLQGKGREGDAVLKRLEKIAHEEKKRAESLESIAGELQMKVISLQKEKDSLYGQINQMGHKMGKGEHATVIAAARERQENLELKVDFLQKAEAASAKRIDELEAIEKELREQLEQQTDPRDVCQRELNKIQELKHQITFLESDNKALSARVAELEENEEILRENWRRVADEDFNRTQCLEEKVKILESLNRDLKSKLTDAQEYFVINTVPQSGNSLAAELAQSRAIRRAATFDDGGGDDDDEDDDSVDGSDSTEPSQVETEKRHLKEKLKQLERQLSDVAEEKNTKIESLQEKIVSLKENEVKLSETISEFEMTERELRAKLALYESSEVTVEKMLKYQSKIEELRTSQESLLDQIESMENQEMTLQEKMQEMERTLRGKIVTLEVEMKGFKQKELKDAARIRELEKQEKELSEKVAQQAEKENGLYVKISSLMDELKKTKDELSTVKTTMQEKEDKVRRANLLEVSFLEKDMENSKKLSALSTKLRHKEEELRQKEAAHQDKIESLRQELDSLRQELSNKDLERTQQIASLEKLFAQKEKVKQATISSLREDVKALTSDRDEYMQKVKEMTNRNIDLSGKDFEYNKELDILRQEVASMKISEKEYEEKISHLQESLQKEKQKALEAVEKVVLLESDLCKEKENVLIIENKIISLKSDIGEKMKNIEQSFVEKEKEYERQRHSLEEELRMKDERVQELERELGDRLVHVRQLEAECEELKSKAAMSENETMEKLADLGKVLAEKDKEFQELQNRLSKKETEFEEQMRSWEAEYEALKVEVSMSNKIIEELKHSSKLKEKEYKEKLSLMEDQAAVHSELRNKLQFLNAQLLHEASAREKDQSALEQAGTREKKLTSEISELKNDVERLRQQMAEKLSELENKNKECSELSLEISSLHHSCQTSQDKLQNLKDVSEQHEQKYQDQITQLNQNIDKCKKEQEIAIKEIQQLKLELSQKDSTIKEKSLENKLLVEETVQKEVLIKEHVQRSEVLMQMSDHEQQSREAELERLNRELFEKEALLKKLVSEQRERDVKMQALQSQVQTLTLELEKSSQNLDNKTSENKKYVQEIELLKQEREEISSKVELLQKQVVEQRDEIEKQSSEQKSSELLISSRQQELEQARSELQKCLQETEEYKKKVESKDIEFQQQNQKCKEISADLTELTVQFKEQSQEFKQLESKVVNAELKLVEAENRYRELEAKCASLEMQLQESFAQAQHAEKVIRSKEEDCQKLGNKLNSIEKDFKATSVQVEEAEKIIMTKDKEFKKLESELEKVTKENEKLKTSMAEKEDKHKEIVGRCLSLETEHQLLKSESSALHQELSSTQSQHEESQNEVKTLEKKLSDLKEDCEHTHRQFREAEGRISDMTFRCESAEAKLKESNNQKLESDMKFETLLSDMKILERRHIETEDKLKHSEHAVIELEKKVEARDTVIKSLQSEIKALELQCEQTNSSFVQAESDVKVNSSQLVTLKDKLHKTEQALRSSEENCDKLKEKLCYTEEKLTENNKSINELTAKISSLEKVLEEKESVCRDFKNDFCSLEHQYLEIKTECENLKSKGILSEQKAEQSQALYNKAEDKLKELESLVEHSKAELNSALNKLSDTESTYKNILSQLEHSQSCLNSSQDEMLHYKHQVCSLQENMKQIVSRNEGLILDLENKEITCKNLISQLEDSKNQAHNLQLQLTEAAALHENVCAKLTESEHRCSSASAELDNFRRNMDSKNSQNAKKYVDLESLCQKLQEETNSKNHILENLKLSEADLKSTVSRLQQDNATLKAKLDSVEGSVHSKDSYLSELIETNQKLSGQLFQAETKLSINDNKVSLLEQKLSEVSSEIDHLTCKVKQLEDEKKQLYIENAKLQEELTISVKQSDSLKSDFNKSKTSSEVHLTEIVNIKEHSEKALKETETKLEKKEDVIKKLEQEIADLKIACFEVHQLKSKVFELEKINAGLRLSLEEPGRTLSEKSVVDESEILVSVSAGLQVEAMPHVSHNDSTEPGNKLSHYDETAVKIEKLMNEIEAYKRSDDENEEKLNNLEKLLKEMREKDVRMSERVSELEGKEKQLLAQIADIEVTVIVPLEAENQELKDEINVVKQERDDARARVGRWGEEDEDQQDVETVHKCLEDALITRDELEKKIEILCKDVSKLEQEKESLMKKIIDLEANEAEHKEKIEALEEEVERLYGLEKTTSLVEETETCLIDRVLDLEEKEQQLLAELAELKNKNLRPASDQTDGQASHESLLERLKHLEKQNAMLKDAEGQYMDKIVELEEIQHRLQSDILSLRSSSSHYSASTEPVLVSADSILLMMQKSTSQKITNDKSESPSQTSTSVSTDTSDLMYPSEQTHNQADMFSQITELENKIKNLTVECTEKSSQIKYLDEKCELLRDSEAKLMEKLLENEDSDANKNNSSSSESELKKKVQNLMEENEFLAESVENFKQLYKDEKEKTNDLQDRIMENSSIVHELHEAKSELKATQQMVEEIQSEYEEQILEREEREAQLSNMLAQSQQREEDLQAQLTALQQREEELQKKISAIVQEDGNTQGFVKLLEEDKLKNLQELEEKLKSQHHQEEEELQKQIRNLQREIFDHQVILKEQETEHQNKLEDIHKHRQELQHQVDILTAKESDLQKLITTLSQREQDLLGQTERLEKQLKEIKAKMDASNYSPEEESIQSDSGMSADDQCTRNDNSEKSSTEQSPPIESSVKIFSSSLTLSLSPPSSPTKRVITSLDETKRISPEPVPPPRRGKARQPSIDSISQEELIFLVEELQNRELVLKKRLRELETLADLDLSQRIEELELQNQQLERKLRYAESQLNRLSLESAVPLQESSKVYANSRSFEDIVEDIQNLDRSTSSALSPSSSHIMLEKPEDVLHKKIKELENLDKHNKIQLTELERDREVLHEITRKDKATIHDLNVKIRELQLSEHSLKEQVSSLEASESSLYTKCEDLEAIKTKLEDRVHELAVHERRLRELVRKLKLDEEHWLSKSGGMESAVAELAANEQQLKRLLQDVEMQKGGLSERAEYLEVRVHELENVEATLLQRLKNYENGEVNLHNKLIQLENSERAAYSKVSELDMMNLDLSQRLQKALEENVVLSQHVTQLQGQIHELDRRLLSAQDSELANKQHMESLQKNESSLQKKVREFELREIDSQAQIRELEQVNEILNDKMAALQRSENRLKFRVQELESVVGRVAELPTTQTQNIPHKLDDTQKHIVLLQNQVENLQLQLRDALKTAQNKLASKTDDMKKVTLSVDDYRQLQTKSALLEETMSQMEEVESLNRELSETIQQLRQGKGASGHEVEIEVFKRRLASYKTFINKLKSSLSVGQATSLWDPELDSGLPGDSLPARQLHGLESERVLQSVRGLQDGKADTSNERGAQQFGLASEKDTIVQSKATLILSTSRRASVDTDDDSGGNKTEQASSQEESHWRAIEARKPKLVASSWGGAIATVGTVAKQATPTHQNGSKQSSTPDVEEVTIGLHLQSESELSSHHRTTQNDTDSSSSPVPPPRRGRAHRVGKSINKNNNVYSSGNESSDGALTESDTPAHTAQATNKKHFANDKSLPSPANKNTQEQSKKRAPLTRFGEDSFYLPSSTQEGVDSLDDGEAPPLPISGPPGEERLAPSYHLSDGLKGRKDSLDSLDSSTSGMSIRDRIAVIERQFQADKHGDKADDEKVLYWKKKANEGLKQAELLERDSKSLKEEISRLEKELEEKHRYIHLFEIWLSNLEELLKNKNKQTDRQLIEQLHQELIRLRSDLKQIGYSRDEAVLDPAALKTELERRNKEIASKRKEIEDLTSQLKQCQQECRNIEGMRQTTLDCLRTLEHELVDLQDKEKGNQTELQNMRLQTEKTKEVYEENLILRDHIHQSEAELLRLRNLCDDFNNLSARYDEMETSKQQAVRMIEPLQAKLERLAKKCQEKDALLHRLGAELRRISYRPSSALDDLELLERTIRQEEYNTDFPQLVNGLRSERFGGHSPSYLDETELHYPFSDSDSVAGSTLKKKRPTPYVSNRPRSAENLGSGPRFQRGAHAHPRSFPEVRKSRAQPQIVDMEGSQGHFVSIADYDPALFSQSGRPGLELELREGELVHIKGPMDRTGYYEAEVNGRIGLVPASYLQPLHGGSHLTGYSSDPRLFEIQNEYRPEERVDMYRPLHQEHHSKVKGNQNLPRAWSKGQSSQATTTQTLFPDPPTGLHVKKIVNESTILLSWSPPRLDNKGNNCRMKLLGYKVFLDNQEYIQILSPKIYDLVMESMDLTQPHHLAVQCLYSGGQLSQRIELVFEGIAQMTQGSKEMVPGLEDLDTDLSSVLDSVHYKRGQRKTVIALYDYNPEQQSPLDYTSFELAFQAGQVMYVYGDPRPDGFFHGEIDDKRGLVPACFVEDIAERTQPASRKDH